MKIYHASSFALAGLVPAAAVAPGGMAAIDLALGVAMPVHSHVAMNFVRDATRRDATRWRERERMDDATRRDAIPTMRAERLTDRFFAATDHQRLRSKGGERTDETGDVGAHGGDDDWIVQVEHSG